MLSGLRYMEQNGLTAIEHPVSLAHVVCAVQKSIVGWSTISGKMKHTTALLMIILLMSPK